MINAQQIHEAMEKNKAVLLEMASEMVRTKSITGNEYEIGQVFKKWLERFGFDTSIVEKEERHPNVIGEWKGAEGPGFVYNGHLDTLPAADPQLWSFDPFGGEVKDGYIQGRGTGDMKCPNAAFMMAMKLLKDVGFSPKGTIHMVYTCDEQVGGARGIQYLLDEGYIRGEYGINGEPSEMKLLLKHKGVQQYVIKVHGKSYAASFSGKDKFFEQTGIDALEKAHKAIAALYEYRDTVLKNRVDPDLGCSVLGVTSLDARSAINLLPGEAVFTIDRRFNPGETFESVTTEILNVLERVKADDPEFKYDYEVTASTPIFDIPRDHPLTKAIQEAYMAVRKQPLEIIAVPWGSDAAHISYRSGVPMPILGPGMMDMIQNEKVSLSNLFDITEIYALTVMQLLS